MLLCLQHCNDISQLSNVMTHYSCVDVDGKQKLMFAMTFIKVLVGDLPRKKDSERYSQVVSSAIDMKLRDDLERLKKIRHYWGLRVRRQHTKTTGRRDCWCLPAALKTGCYSFDLRCS
ncbi:hypothetical protein MKX03_015775 [Papaver bracteatum]|nr:hypothetical protein MKX03_015775 [Papaver bracteatum]